MVCFAAAARTTRWRLAGHYSNSEYYDCYSEATRRPYSDSRYCGYTAASPSNSITAVADYSNIRAKEATIRSSCL